MNLAYRVQAFVSLGKILQNNLERYDSILTKVYQHNPWFTIENQKLAISNVVEFFLNEQKLNEWMDLYPHLKESDKPKEIGLILAGNIPLVGFHDFLCVLISGNIALIKCSDKDPFLLPFLAELLIELAPGFKNYIHFVDRLVDYDAVIATGSNNSARYFEQYFSSKPHIIRKNRQAVAILNGNESPEDLMNLGKDIFTYFGLGCRNVSKIYVPQHYDFTLLLDQLHSFKEIILHNSYKNNFDYQSAIWLLNKVPHFMTGSVLVTEEKSISSKIATLHYEYYSSLSKLTEDLMASLDEIQCVVGMEKLPDMNVIPFGQAQNPTLAEYADGVDTMAFLVRLSFNSNTQI
ncbi:MAG: acyl-CoA reductase [Saprospiraceae bacterium]|nr:acyl-CoA reductase [Saprospiraceae bacterium]